MIRKQEAVNVDIIDTYRDPSSLEQLAGLMIEVVKTGASIGFLPPLSTREAIRYWEKVLDEQVILWVARLHGKVVGTVQLQLCGKPNGRHRAEIAKLMVHPGAQRQGIGRLLMNSAELRAIEEGRRLLVLDTRAGDPSNVLYLSLGYVEAGRIPNYSSSADGQLHETVYYYKVLQA